mgnify:FL=1
MVRVELEWTKQIVEHIEKVLNSQSMTEHEKIKSIEWLVRQLKKTDRDA